MIKMLPLITPKALSPALEEADDAAARAKVGQFAFRLDDALDDVQHRLDMLKQEGQQLPEVQKIVSAFQKKFYAARREATKLLRY